jgi:hypothetical protein
MNESDLEAELRALRPVATSPALASRINRDLAESAKVVPPSPAPVAPEESILAKILRPLFWTTIGATAAIAVMSSRGPVEQPANPRASAPIAIAPAPDPTPETTRELLGTQQSDIRYEKDRGLVREVRASYLEHVAWTDQRTGGRVEVSIPREDVYLQPIAMQ